MGERFAKAPAPVLGQNQNPPERGLRIDLPRRQKPGIGHQFLPIESAKVDRLPVEAIGIEIKTVLLQNENFLAYAQYFIKQLARQFMKMIFFPFNRHGRV